MTQPKPVYLLAGRWGKNPDPVISRVIKESGIAKPSIGYIGAAAGDNIEFFKRMESYFQMGGAGVTTLVPTVNPKADMERSKDLLEKSDIVFISGGDVEVGMQILQQRKLVKFIKELYLSGKPFFAVSAGSIMLAQEWVRWRDPDDDNSAEIFPCIGVAPVLCDTHGEADKWEELIALLQLEKSGTIGYGIVSGNAVKVNPDGTVEALSGIVNRFIRQKNKVEMMPDLMPDK
ncbi:MAG: Type 1 glutamine amidotransferase-like domain-containing protein [Dehalococcoidales bacterium]|nr:Type 1 glutamine amidotransferase-like domain-containing protein [Dehalococcoidales bacterium]